MSIVDSVAVFRDRALRNGMSEPVYTLLKDSGLDTLGKLAFASSYVPGSSDDTPFVDLVKRAFKRDPSIAEMAIIRRLFNESYAAASQEMKTLIEQTDEGPSRKLAPAERSERFSAQQKRLKGITIRGQTEPGDSLVDTAVNIYESDRLRYIEWQFCVSREHEILTSSKKDTSLSFDASGNLKMNSKKEIVPCEATSDLQVRYCLTRRGLALEQGNVMSYANHEMWMEKLFAVRMMDPPPGYQRVSFKQMQWADAKLFVVLGERTRDGVKLNTAGKYIDEVFEGVMNCNEVQHLLQPMPGPATQSQKPTSTVMDTGVNKTKSFVKRTIEKRQGGKAAGKKGKTSSTWKPSVPQELLAMGCVGVTNRGNPLCYDFQLGKCTLPVTDRRCQKGWRLCAIAGCHRDHPAKDCNGNPKKRE